MKSSSGQHYIALDHVRALAAFMVFTWHFSHGRHGYPVPFEGAPSFFPFSLFDEGHTGVALFMTLSGYLFAKLLNGKSINFKYFIWNRALRLFPLLAVVIVFVGRDNLFDINLLYQYGLSILKGFVFPSLPNGGWSITVELHYYLILPLFLWMLRKSEFLPISLILGAILIRAFFYQVSGEIQSLAYWTLVGRIDQFALGMLIFQFRAYIAHRHLFATTSMMLFAVFYWYFDNIGGFYQFPSYPSPSMLWVFLPTFEGVTFALAIAWYDNSFSPSSSGISRFIGHIGTYSYSIYLLHFFIVFKMASFVQENIMDISNFYISLVWSFMCFLLMIPVGYLSFQFIEKPFLKLRKSYTIAS